MTSSSNSLYEASLGPTALSRVSLTRVSRPGSGLCQSLPVSRSLSVFVRLSLASHLLCVSPVPVPVCFPRSGLLPTSLPYLPLPIALSLSLSLCGCLSVPPALRWLHLSGSQRGGGGGGAEPRLWVHLRLRLLPSPFPQCCLVGGVRGTAAPTSRGTLPRHPPFLTPFGALAAAPGTSVQRLELRGRDRDLERHTPPQRCQLEGETV